MTNSRISIERNEGRIELKTLQTDEWTFLEDEPRYAVSVLDEEETRALLQQLITALAGTFSDQPAHDGSSDIHVLLNLSTGETNLVFSALCFALPFSLPGTGNRAQLLEIVPKLIRHVATVWPLSADDMQGWFQSVQDALSQEL